MMATVNQMIKDKNPEQVFMEECKKRGANPDSILNIAKMFIK